MVNKQWLHEAAEAFFSSLRCRCIDKWNVFNLGTPFYRNNPFLGLEFLTHLEVNGAGLMNCATQLARVCTRLRTLKVHIDHRDLEKMFDDRNDRCVWYEDWTVEHLKESRWFRTASVLSGLTEASVVLTRVCHRYYSNEEVDRFYANHRLMHLVFQRSATRPRSTAASSAISPSTPPFIPFSPPLVMCFNGIMEEFDRSVTKTDFLMLVQQYPSEAAIWMANAKAKLTANAIAANAQLLGWPTQR